MADVLGHIWNQRALKSSTVWCAEISISACSTQRASRTHHRRANTDQQELSTCHWLAPSAFWPNPQSYSRPHERSPAFEHAISQPSRSQDVLWQHLLSHPRTRSRGPYNWDVRRLSRSDSSRPVTAASPSASHPGTWLYWLGDLPALGSSSPGNWGAGTSPNISGWRHASAVFCQLCLCGSTPATRSSAIPTLGLSFPQVCFLLRCTRSTSMYFRNRPESALGHCQVKAPLFHLPWPSPCFRMPNHRPV